jgi:DedD protein
VVGLPTVFDKPPRSADQSFNVRMMAPDGSATVSVRSATAVGQVPVERPASSVVVAPEPRSIASVSPAGPSSAAGLLPFTGKKPPADEAIITEPKPDLRAEASARAARVAREQAQADKLRADKLKADKAREAEKIREAEQAREAEKARVAKKAREKAAKEARSARTDAEDDKPRRYVIQAGSFAEASAARDLGRRIDKLGLDSHEQRVETAAGQPRTRVRLGPFKTKEEAQRAAARLKAAGLNAAVLPL